MTNRHVFDHALTQRADGLGGHGDTPVSHEVANPMILRQNQPSRYAALQCAARNLAPGNLPRERFSSLAPSCRDRFRQAGRLTEEYRARAASTPQETTTRAPAIWGRSPNFSA